MKKTHKFILPFVALLASSAWSASAFGLGVTAVSANALKITDQSTGYTLVQVNDDGVVVTQDQNQATCAKYNTSIAVVSPGAGWDGPTTIPPDQGNAIAAGYTQVENAIGQIDATPLPTLNAGDEMCIGIPAFHSSGMQFCSFSVENGTWVYVATPLPNPSTVNTSSTGINYDAAGKGVYVGGVVEYCVKVRANDFDEDGVQEIRVLLYPEDGACIIRSYQFISNKNGTWDPVVKTVGGGGDYASVAAAIKAQALIGPVNNLTLEVLDGTSYTIGDSNDHTLTINGRVLIKPQNAYGDVVFVGKTGGEIGDLEVNGIILWQDIQFSPPDLSSGNAMFNGGSGTSHCFKGCLFNGPGITIDMNWSVSGLAPLTYQEDCAWTNGKEGGISSLTRNRRVYHTGQGGGQANSNFMVINDSITDTVSNGTDFHAHGYQLYSGGPLETNIIIYGTYLTASGDDGGGMGFLGDNPVTDIAVVSCYFNNQLTPNAAQVWGPKCDGGGYWTNMVVSNSDFKGSFAWRTDLGFLAKDIRVNNCRMSGTPDPYPLSGVTYSNTQFNVGGL